MITWYCVAYMGRCASIDVSYYEQCAQQVNFNHIIKTSCQILPTNLQSDRKSLNQIWLPNGEDSNEILD